MSADDIRRAVRARLIPAIVAAACAGGAVGDMSRQPAETRVQADQVPPGLAPLLIQTLQAASDSSYHVVAGLDGSAPVRAPSLEAANRAHAFTTQFTPQGVTIRPGAGTGEGPPLEILLAAYGSPEQRRPIAMQSWTTDGLRAERTSTDPARPLVEWYVNGTLGLEQGFTIAAPPEVADALVVELAVGEGWRARGAGADAIALEEIDGAGSLRYGQLTVVDAEGAVLPATMTAREQRIVIQVAATGAQYPVTIDPVFQAHLAPSDRALGDLFGVSIHVSGDTAIVGSYGNDVGGNSNQGSAYVFVRSGTTWTLQQKLTASDGAANDSFGVSVAISSDTAIAGAWHDDVGANADQGSAYVFVRSGTTWTEQQKLTASDGGVSDNFGVSVAISADTAIIGASLDDVGANTDQGSAYVFVRTGTTWSEQQKLTASNGATGDRFGGGVLGQPVRGVDVSGETAIVGAPLDDVSANADRGSAYVFIRSGTTWSQQAQLTASDGAAGDRLGSVAISGDTAVVGAPSDANGENTNQGSAYVFVRGGTTWSQQAKLTANDGAFGDLFGNSVAVSADTVVVGAPARTNLDFGAAYLFRRSGGTWNQQVMLEERQLNHALGGSVAVSGTIVLIGTFQAAAGGRGDAYVYINNPTMTDIADQTVNEDMATTALTLTIGDSENDVSSLTVSGSSSNTTLVPDGSIAFGGEGANRTVTVTPAWNQSGSATITIMVSNGTNTVDSTFKVTVTTVNDAPTISSIANQAARMNGHTDAVPFTIGDVETASLTVSYSSSNPALVPNVTTHQFVEIGGTGPSRTVQMSPAGNQTGTTTITILVSDGAAVSSTSFTLRVVPYLPFTDEALTGGSSVIREIHISELRARTDAQRRRAGLDSFVFTDPFLVARTTVVRAQHILDLRTALAEAYTGLGVPPPTYTDPALSPGGSIRAVHVTELRAAVGALESQ